eukprot:366119-Chlamydomonas_euryale.AAC.27
MWLPKPPPHPPEWHHQNMNFVLFIGAWSTCCQISGISSGLASKDDITLRRVCWIRVSHAYASKRVPVILTQTNAALDYLRQGQDFQK